LLSPYSRLCLLVSLGMKAAQLYVERRAGDGMRRTDGRILAQEVHRLASAARASV